MWPNGSRTATAPARPSSAAPAGLHPPAPPSRPARQAPEAYAGFDCVQSEDARVSDGRGWTGPATRDNRTLPYIQAEGDLPFVNVPAKLRELIDHCWKLGSVSLNASRGHVQIGGGKLNHLQQAQNSWRPADIIAANRIKEQGQYVKDVSPIHAHYQTIAQDWKLTEQLERVNAYTFRGDRRNPRAVEADGGFHPPISRTDREYIDNVVFPRFANYMKRRFNMVIPQEQFNRIYNQAVVSPQDQMAMKTYFSWRALVEIESHHISRMMASQILKNYISTSKDVGVAKSFLIGAGWIYVTLVRGGFHISGEHVWGQRTGVSEQEIAIPGTLRWSDVFGFRECLGGLLVGPLYLRQGFEARNPSAYKEVFELMSNKRQTL